LEWVRTYALELAGGLIAPARGTVAATIKQDNVSGAWKELIE
jgi:hypothetical protein